MELSVCPKGRPMKYRHYIEILEDERIYTPATIVDHGIAHGLFPIDLKESAGQSLRLKIRHALSRLSLNRGFPRIGDGLVFVDGQAPSRGWYGFRWKSTL